MYTLIKINILLKKHLAGLIEGERVYLLGIIRCG
jgi:hypothetical protein